MLLFIAAIFLYCNTVLAGVSTNDKEIVDNKDLELRSDANIWARINLESDSKASTLDSRISIDSSLNDSRKTTSDDSNSDISTGRDNNSNISTGRNGGNNTAPAGRNGGKRDKINNDISSTIKSKMTSEDRSFFDLLFPDNKECNLKTIKSILIDDEYNLGKFIETNGIPPTLFKCKNLKNLNLSNVFISKIPDEIKSLKNLQEIFIQCSNLKFVHPNIFQPPSLKNFIMKKSLMKSLNINFAVSTKKNGESEICPFRNIETIIIAENRLLAEITFTKDCDADFLASDKNIQPNGIKSIFPNVKKLVLSSNDLEFLPIEMSGMNKLEYFDCSENKIAEMPDIFKGCNQIKTIILSGNKLKFVPSSILKLKTLEILDVRDNPLNPYNESGEINSPVGWIELYRHFIFENLTSVAQMKNSVLSINRLLTTTSSKTTSSKPTSLMLENSKWTKFLSAKLILQQETQPFHWNFRLISKIYFDRKITSEESLRNIKLLLSFIRSKISTDQFSVLEKYLHILNSPNDTVDFYFVKRYLMREFTYFTVKMSEMIESGKIKEVQTYIEYLGEYIEIQQRSIVLTLTSICENIYLSKLERQTLEVFGAEINYIFQTDDEIQLRDEIIYIVYKSIFLFKNICLREVISETEIFEDSKIPQKEFYKSKISEYIGFDTLEDVPDSSEDEADILSLFLSKFTVDRFLKSFMGDCNNKSQTCIILEKFLRLFYSKKKVSKFFNLQKEHQSLAASDGNQILVTNENNRNSLAAADNHNQNFAASDNNQIVAAADNNGNYLTTADDNNQIPTTADNNQIPTTADDNDGDRLKITKEGLIEILKLLKIIEGS